MLCMINRICMTRKQIINKLQFLLLSRIQSTCWIDEQQKKLVIFLWVVFGESGFFFKLVETHVVVSLSLSLSHFTLLFYYCCLFQINEYLVVCTFCRYWRLFVWRRARAFVALFDGFVPSSWKYGKRSRHECMRGGCSFFCAMQPLLTLMKITSPIQVSTWSLFHRVSPFYARKFDIVALPLQAGSWIPFCNHHR